MAIVCYPLEQDRSVKSCFPFITSICINTLPMLLMFPIPWVIKYRRRLMLSHSYADFPWLKVGVQHIDRVSTQNPTPGHSSKYHCRSETMRLVYSNIDKRDIYPWVTHINRHLALGALLGPFDFNIPCKTDDNSYVSYPHLHYFNPFSVPK